MGISVGIDFTVRFKSPELLWNVWAALNEKARWKWESVDDELPNCYLDMEGSAFGMTVYYGDGETEEVEYLEVPEGQLLCTTATGCSWGDEISLALLADKAARLEAWAKDIAVKYECEYEIHLTPTYSH